MVQVRGSVHSQGLVTQLNGGGSGGGLERGISCVWFLSLVMILAGGSPAVCADVNDPRLLGSGAQHDG